MATSFQHDCPHCRTRRSGFAIVGQHLLRKDPTQNFLTAVCSVCDVPVLFYCDDLKMRFREVSHPINLVQDSVDFPSDRYRIMDVWPEGSGDTPTDLPDNVQNFYEQGIQNERAANWDAAGAMFRKALDVTTKVLDPSNSSKTLFQRIELLAQEGRITDDLRVWAHEVRIDGNASVHEDDPETSEDVIAIHQFCRAVLLYCFSLPALVAARQAVNESA